MKINKIKNFFLINVVYTCNRECFFESSHLGNLFIQRFYFFMSRFFWKQLQETGLGSSCSFDSTKFQFFFDLSAIFFIFKEIKDPKCGSFFNCCKLSTLKMSVSHSWQIFVFLSKVSKSINTSGNFRQKNF